MTIGESIRIARTRVGIRQRELARRAGVSQGIVSLIENGKRQPTIEVVKRLCESMGVPVQLVLLLACESEQSPQRFRPAIDKLSLLMLDLLRTVQAETNNAPHLFAQQARNHSWASKKAT